MAITKIQTFVLIDGGTMKYPVYHGHYKSATTSLTGCIKEFVSLPQNDLLFPPQVNYYCDLCKEEHNFRFLSGWQVASPKQFEDIKVYCSERSIERDVAIN